MSSTNRGYERHKTDYYVTPKNEIKDFLLFFQKVIKHDLYTMKNSNWLDPCCGGDEKNGASYIDVIKQMYNPKQICGIDIRDDSKADVIMDYLDCEKENMCKHDIIISNPPFYLAEDFVKKSFEFVKERGYIVFLLRLNFFGSKKRKPLFENNMPKYCFVHHKRMSFTDNGSTDSIEYAHFVWKKGEQNNSTELFLI